MSKTALITGATGMVGSHVLNLLLNRDDITKVISIGRRKTELQSNQLEEIIHKDFLDFSPIKDRLNNIDICVYCLGVYQGQVSTERFFEITCDFQKALTDILQETSPNLTFCLFGAQGADPTEKSRTTFARAKGKAENLLNATSFPKKYIFRPGYIHPTADKKPAGMMYKVMLPFAGSIIRFLPSMGIADIDLARAMVNVGMANELESRVFSNQEMKAFTAM